MNVMGFTICLSKFTEYKFIFVIYALRIKDYYSKSDWCIGLAGYKYLYNASNKLNS